MRLKMLVHLLFVLMLAISCSKKDVQKIERAVKSTAGDLFDEDRKTQELEAASSCTLNTDAISNYFVKIITKDLECLGSYLNDFVQVVKTDRPGYLSKTKLVKFIDDNLKDFDPALVNPLEAIFDMNSLLYGDDPNYISLEHVNDLISVFIDVNKYVVNSNIYEYFSDLTTKTYKVHNYRKSAVFTGFNRIADLLISEHKGHENNNRLVLSKFLNKFRALDSSRIIENSSKLLFVKKVILGGQKDELTSKELMLLLRKLSDLGKMVFDVSQFKLIDHDNFGIEKGLVNTLFADMRTVKRSLFYSKFSEEELFTIDELFDAILIFTDKIEVYRKYKNNIQKLKGALLSSESDIFTARDISILVDDIILDNLERGVFFYRLFGRYEKELLSQKNLENIRFYAYTIDKKERNYLDSFSRIAKKYAYFKGHNSSAKFIKNYGRTPFSMFEISVFENILLRLYKKYATQKNEKYLYGIGLSQKNLNDLMGEYLDILEGEGIVHPGQYLNNAETITLMTTLFQHQSNGNAIMEINEATEFALDLISSGSIANAIDTEMKKLCIEDSDCHLDAKGRYLPEFYRKKYKQMFNTKYNGSTIADHLPGLYNYLESLSAEKIDEFFYVAERFSRSCTLFEDGSPVPMESGDYFSMFAGLMAIEQTINKFDQRGIKQGSLPDGILQPVEAEIAYPIYEDAIKAIIPVESLKKDSKVFFWYLLKYEQVPDVEGNIFRTIGQGAKFLWFKAKKEKNQKSSATRFTIAKILEVLAFYSEAAVTNPFPCEELR
ncbi:MAG: hypothetical protein N4A33_12635 [Bacteriovoracaceae bacterium]|jgi:hypothetical protein|nr:hypothetical protein [Bacteriovoracaceae bacterium]